MRRLEAGVGWGRQARSHQRGRHGRRCQSRSDRTRSTLCDKCKQYNLSTIYFRELRAVRISMHLFVVLMVS